ncbi:hypothetical protein Misp01_33170 [Microtetraspora sp. NBRC 13810]|uniref:hypothetical protein n=1 Tax=Microtetraspora sp. NBRC 13810 TaxID=3030990 RepID=UPI0024A5D35B|nr:hypothetical protein [Microtetraspora sp. NBRC 13810]GLW08187.1 hypothetical protein Misp01_33170 [Microtetraspora sp. NBRC 13810]
MICARAGSKSHSAAPTSPPLLATPPLLAPLLTTSPLLTTPAMLAARALLAFRLEDYLEVLFKRYG